MIGWTSFNEKPIQNIDEVQFHFKGISSRNTATPPRRILFAQVNFSIRIRVYYEYMRRCDATSNTRHGRWCVFMFNFMYKGAFVICFYYSRRL